MKAIVLGCGFGINGLRNMRQLRPLLGTLAVVDAAIAPSTRALAPAMAAVSKISLRINAEAEFFDTTFQTSYHTHRPVPL